MAVVLLLIVSGCASRSRGAQPPRIIEGGLLVSCIPSDAEVIIDGRFVGVVSSVGGRPIPLPEGLHRVELRRDGYFSAYHEVRGVRGVRQRLQVELRQVPF